MMEEVVDGELVVRYEPGRIVATLKDKTWTFLRYEGRLCSRCGNPLQSSNDTDLCGACNLCYGFSSVTYVSLYDKNIDDLVRRSILALKNGRQFYADIFGISLTMLLENETHDYVEDSILASVPTHPDDHPDRDYNPPDMLARKIATFTPLRYRPDALEKVEPHSQKDHTTSKERFEEIQGKFACRSRLDGQRVLLVDDLMTTGATASECARMCMEEGAKLVDVLVAGRNFHFLEDREYG